MRIRSSLIQFHGRSVVVDGGGHIAYASAITGGIRRMIFLFGLCLLLLVGTVIFSYGRTIWSHARYWAKAFGGSSKVATGALSESAAYTALISEPLVLAETSAAETATVSSTAPSVWPISSSPPAPEPSSKPQAVTQPRSAKPAFKSATIGEISIGKMDVIAPIVTSEQSLKSINASLHNGVVFWPDSYAFGSGGTSIILGHSSAPLSYRGKYGATFSLLEKLESGDVITVKFGESVYAYRVRDQLIINPKKEKPDLLNQGGEVLLLVSCWPVGTNWQRIMVRADRVF